MSGNDSVYIGEEMKKAYKSLKAAHKLIEEDLPDDAICGFFYQNLRGI